MNSTRRRWSLLVVAVAAVAGLAAVLDGVLAQDPGYEWVLEQQRRHKEMVKEQEQWMRTQELDRRHRGAMTQRARLTQRVAVLESQVAELQVRVAALVEQD